jgi:cytochrome c553
MLAQFIASHIASKKAEVRLKWGLHGPIFYFQSEINMPFTKTQRAGLIALTVTLFTACADNEVKKTEPAKVEMAKTLSPSAIAGRTKANAVCAACHGNNGFSQLINAPHLAGQPEIYLKEQLKAYRSGKRAHEVMAVIAKPLTDDEITNLAAWYSSIEIKIGELK